MTLNYAQSKSKNRTPTACQSYSNFPHDVHIFELFVIRSLHYPYTTPYLKTTAFFIQPWPFYINLLSTLHLALLALSLPLKSILSQSSKRDRQTHHRCRLTIYTLLDFALLYHIPIISEMPSTIEHSVASIADSKSTFCLTANTVGASSSSSQESSKTDPSEMEVRRLARRKQNIHSVRKYRARKRREQDILRRESEGNKKRIVELEAIVARLTAQLIRTTATLGHSHQNNVWLDGASSTHQESATPQATNGSIQLTAFQENRDVDGQGRPAWFGESF